VGPRLPENSRSASYHLDLRIQSFQHLGQRLRRLLLPLEASNQFNVERPASSRYRFMISADSS